jgi:hypothetical protein
MSSARRKKILVKGNDYDDCLGWVSIIGNEKYQQDCSLSFRAPLEKVIERFLAESPYGQQIKTELQDPDVEKLLIMSASNRQRIAADMLNRYQNFHRVNNCDNGSVFRLFPLFATELNKINNKCEYDAVTFNDLWTDKKPGTEYASACQLTYPNGSHYPVNEYLNTKHLLRQWHEYCDDSFQAVNNSKINLIYTQLHYLSNKYPDQDIIYDFYDDRADICRALYTAFLHAPELLPSNITLRINHYDLFPPTVDIIEKHIMETKPSQKIIIDGIETTIRPIQGTGDCQKNIRKSALALHAACVMHGLTDENINQFATDQIRKAMTHFINFLLRQAEKNKSEADDSAIRQNILQAPQALFSSQEAESNNSQSSTPVISSSTPKKSL